MTRTGHIILTRVTNATHVVCSVHKDWLHFSCDEECPLCREQRLTIEALPTRRLAEIDAAQAKLLERRLTAGLHTKVSVQTVDEVVAKVIEQHVTPCLSIRCQTGNHDLCSGSFKLLDNSQHDWQDKACDCLCHQPHHHEPTTTTTYGILASPRNRRNG